MPPKSKKRAYDAAFKLSVIDCAEKTTNRGAARKFGVDERRVREWRQKKEGLEELPSKKKRLEGGGRKAAYPEVEDEVVAWIEGCREQNFRVSRSSVQTHAIEVANSHGNTICNLHGDALLICVFL